MNDIMKYLMFVLFGDQDRAKITLGIMITLIPLAAIIVMLPPIFNILAWVLAAFGWRWMILDIKKKL